MWLIFFFKFDNVFLVLEGVWLIVIFFLKEKLIFFVLFIELNCMLFLNVYLNFWIVG